MPRVLLTVDTEIWPASSAVFTGRGDATLDLRPAIAAYFDGHTAEGDFGVPFQLDVLREHGLQATYFVEPMFSRVAGAGALQDMVSHIRRGRQDIQLHVHTEWLGLARMPGLPAIPRTLLRLYSQTEQTAIIASAARMLQEAGTDRLRAFRAGSYGANLATLQALAANQIPFDTSLNLPYLGSACDIRTEHAALQPFHLGGTLEVPITCFTDWPGHRRPLQLGACSSAEIEAVLWQAARGGWGTVVLVLHSSEMLRHVPDMASVGAARPARVVIRRFERLCRFLARHRDTFDTVTFAQLNTERLTGPQPAEPPASHVARTAWRYLEQFAARFI